MTAKQYPAGATKNKEGNGRGLKVVTKPITKKRGTNAKPEARALTVQDNRSKYTQLTGLTPDQLAELDPDRPLTDKAKLFVKFWAQGESITSASMRAGYGDGASYAYRLVHTPAAKALYLEEKRLYEEAGQITRKDVMDMLKESYDMAKMTAEPSTMVAAARELGKICGYYDIKIKVEHSTTPGGPADMTRRSDEELLELIRQASLPLPAPGAKP